tara:strand:+ start:1068 stop:1190 length:123 start_codon:yes stop_codon:yes gene_type:complete
MIDKAEIKRLQRTLQKRNPSWSQDKARLIAEQALGLRVWR